MNNYVFDELCSLLARKSNHKTAIRAIRHVRDSDALPIVRVTDEVFERAMDTFAEYDGQEIPFTDHAVSAHAFAHEAPVFTFDVTDFEILGNDVIPRRLDAS